MRRRNKIETIYALRKAAEEKARAEAYLQKDRSDESQATLLDAQLNLEAKTQDAIEVCHECGHLHHPAEAHGAITGRHDNVLDVDFQRNAGSERNPDAL